MKPTLRFAAALAAAALALQPLAARAVQDAHAERAAADRVEVSWRSDGPVDVYVATRSDAPLATSRLVSRSDRDGAYELRGAAGARPYFVLRNRRDGSITRVAERLLPLAGGSNFRDVGGYPAAGGRHVRWGLIYRTGATPLLTPADFRYVGRLGIAADIDLRSSEERQLAPDRLPARTGARYFAVDYPGADIFPAVSPPSTQPAIRSDRPSGYRAWLISLAPQYREIFRQLLRGRGAVTYHCSAGQDRTGVATALVLSALGVPRDVILADYHLSTRDRRPENEMPRIDAARYPGNVVAAFYARQQSAGPPARPRPLYDASGASQLQQTFDEIDTHWGSVEAYLDQELGVGPRDITRLRALYLE